MMEVINREEDVPAALGIRLRRNLTIICYICPFSQINVISKPLFFAMCISREEFSNTLMSARRKGNCYGGETPPRDSRAPMK